MAKVSRRTAEAVKAVQARLEAAVNGKRKKNRLAGESAECRAAQRQYAAALELAAEKQIALEDAQAAYDTAFYVAMAALIVMYEECSV